MNSKYKGVYSSNAADPQASQRLLDIYLYFFSFYLLCFLIPEIPLALLLSLSHPLPVAT